MLCRVQKPSKLERRRRRSRGAHAVRALVRYFQKLRPVVPEDPEVADPVGVILRMAESVFPESRADAPRERVWFSADPDVFTQRVKIGVRWERPELHFPIWNPMPADLTVPVDENQKFKFDTVPRQAWVDHIWVTQRALHQMKRSTVIQIAEEVVKMARHLQELSDGDVAALVSARRSVA